MAYYSKDEQETCLVYDAVIGKWRAFSTYPPDIRKLLDKAEVIHTETDSDGKTIMVDGYLARSHVRIYG